MTATSTAAKPAAAVNDTIAAGAAPAEETAAGAAVGIDIVATAAAAAKAAAADAEAGKGAAAGDAAKPGEKLAGQNNVSILATGGATVLRFPTTVSPLATMNEI